MSLPAAIALASSSGRICVVAASKNSVSFLSASALSRSVVKRATPCALASSASLASLRPTRIGSGITLSPLPSSTPPSLRMATMERTRCWLVPMRPVTPFMMMPSRCTAMPLPPLVSLAPVTVGAGRLSTSAAVAADQEADDALEPGVVGRGHQAGRRQPALQEYAFGMAEGVEAVAAVVAAHATGADASERQLFLREVVDGVVDRDAAGHRGLQDLADAAAAGVEIVERQG